MVFKSYVSFVFFGKDNLIKLLVFILCFIVSFIFNYSWIDYLEKNHFIIFGLMNWFLVSTIFLSNALLVSCEFD